MCTDGGVENTGNSRARGDGEKGLFARMFKGHAVWTWCLKHVLSIVFGDTDLSLTYNMLNTISRFLRCANRWRRMKPHILLILKHLMEAEGRTLSR